MSMTYFSIKQSFLCNSTTPALDAKIFQASAEIYGAGKSFLKNEKTNGTNKDP